MNKQVMKHKFYNLYSIKWKRGDWTPPFLAPSDGIALNALIEMSHQCPDLQNKYLCQIGTFNPSNGEIKGLRRPRIVVRKVNKEESKDEVQN